MDSLKRGVYECMQKLSLGIVWRELQVLSKLLYKGRNQHRRDKSFQRLLRVSKDLKKYQAISLSNYVKRVWKMLPRSGSLSASVVQSVNDLSSRLVQCAQHTAKLLQFIETTYIDVNTRLCMNLFIPFNLLMVSSLSRIWYCLRCHLHAISEAFSIFDTHIPTNQRTCTVTSILDVLPTESKHYLNTESSLPSTSNVGTAVVRVEAVPSLSVEQQKVDQITSAPTVEACPRDTSVSTEVITNTQHEATSAWKSRRMRKPNTVVCAIRVGRQLTSLRIKCPRYLQGVKRQTLFGVRLLDVNIYRRHPWSSGLLRRGKLKPLSLWETCVRRSSVGSKVKQTSNTNRTECRHAAKPCDDIDDIFSALDL